MSGIPVTRAGRRARRVNGVRVTGRAAPRDRSGDRRAALAEVLDAFAAVTSSRRPGRAPFDPARADRSSTRRHGATRHGQRAAAFAARRPAARAAALEQLDTFDTSVRLPVARNLELVARDLGRTGRAG